jgi:hypothetical protein
MWAHMTRAWSPSLTSTTVLRLSPKKTMRNSDQWTGPVTGEEEDTRVGVVARRWCCLGQSGGGVGPRPVQRWSWAKRRRQPPVSVCACHRRRGGRHVDGRREQGHPARRACACRRRRVWRRVDVPCRPRVRSSSGGGTRPLWSTAA